MKEKNIALFQRETYAPSSLTKFLWWLSTTEKEILADAAIDRNRYSIIGMTVLATWTFATFAWTYFFFTVVNSILIAILLGIFMGAIILTIDRALIKGITKYNKSGNSLFLLYLVIPLIRALSIVKIIKPINIPNSTAISKELIAVKKKYVQANVANAQVASTVIPIILYRFRSMAASAKISFSVVESHHKNLVSEDGA